MRWSVNKLATQAFEACDLMRRAQSADEIKDLLVRQMTSFGFDYLTCAAVPAPGQDPLRGVLLNTRPLDYVNHYLEHNYAFTDPAVTELRYGIATFSWTDIKARRDLSRKELAIVNEAQEFGIRDGLTIPIVTTSGSVSLVCPCGEKPELGQHARSAIELIAMTGHQMLKRAEADLERQKRGGPQEFLTPREREVMQWVLIGKADDEIGDILSISAKTVNHHIENAKRKLGAARRTLALAEALRRGEISL